MHHPAWSLGLIIGAVGLAACGSGGSAAPGAGGLAASDFLATIDENPTAGRPLGQLVSAGGTAARRYRLGTQSPAGALSLDAVTGELSVADAGLFDYESRTEITASFTVSEGSESDSANIRVALNNLLDYVRLDDQSVSLDENPPAAATVASFNAMSDGLQGLRYSLLSESVSGAFAVDALSGTVSVADPTAFDYESRTSLTARLQAAHAGASDEADLTVNLNDLAESVSAQDATVFIDENPASGSLVTTVSATGPGGLSFEIAQQDPAGAFALERSSGELSVADASLFDFEQRSMLSVVVNVSHGASADSATITVKLRDIAETSWVQEASASNLGNVYDHQIVHFNGQLWAIGGLRGLSRSNAVYRSSDGSSWTEVPPSGPIFAPLNGHQVLVFNQRLWVLGGIHSGARSNEVWSTADGQSWTLETTSGVFSARGDHAATVFDGRIWVVGGSDGSLYNDVWNSTDGRNWSRLNTPGGQFSPRLGHSLVSFDNQLVLIGGADLNGGLLVFLDDIWTSSDGINWSRITSTGQRFTGRWLHAAIVHRGLLWILGGDDDRGNRFAEAWTSADLVSWTEEDRSTIFPARDNAAAFVHDGRLWLSGGSANSGVFGDLWATD